MGDELRARLEVLTGSRLPALRLHTDRAADERAREVGADAVTAQGAISFRKGRYDPGSDEGLRLLGHELGHAAREPQAVRASNGVLAEDRETEAHADATGETLAGRSADDPYASWSALSAAYTRFAGDLVLANAKSVTVRRREIGAEVQRQWAAIGAPGELTTDELEAEWETYHSLRDDMAIEAATARAEWDELVRDYEAEQAILAGEGDRQSAVAAEILQREYEDSAGRVRAVGDILVTEDFLALGWMLTRNTHLDRADVEVRDEEEELAAAEAALAGLKDERVPGLGELALDVLGWDSPADFLGDVALTVLTGGIGKALRFARKGRAAYRGYKRAKRLQRLSRARRLDRFRQAAEQITRALESFQGEPGLLKGFVDFITQSAPELVRKIATDLIAASASGTLRGRSPAPDVLPTAVSNVTKEYIASLLEGMGVTDTKDAEEEAFRGAVALFVVRDTRLGTSMLRHYLGLNFKRHALVNIVHIALTRMTDDVGRLLAGEPVELDVRRAPTEFATATTGEMLEDLVKQAGVVGAGFSLALGALRKTLQKLVEAALEA